VTDSTLRVVPSTVDAGDAVQSASEATIDVPNGLQTILFTRPASAATSDAHFPRSFRGSCLSGPGGMAPRLDMTPVFSAAIVERELLDPHAKDMRTRRAKKHPRSLFLASCASCTSYKPPTAQPRTVHQTRLTPCDTDIRSISSQIPQQENAF
jgi:hypothetical protein